MAFNFIFRFPCFVTPNKHPAKRNQFYLWLKSSKLKMMWPLSAQYQKLGDGHRDVPLEIAGIAVQPGQWLYADADGVIVSATALG